MLHSRVHITTTRGHSKLNNFTMVDSTDSGSVSKLSCLIADSAAFLRNVDLQNLSDHIFTINEVVGEIRDAGTKQRLAVLPYELDFRTPSAESLQFGKHFLIFFDN